MKRAWIGCTVTALLLVAGARAGPIMNAATNNGDFHDGYTANGWWSDVGAPTGWSGSPADSFYNTAAGFVQGYAGGTATCNTGVPVDTSQVYKITADLGGFSNVRANVYVYGTENADGSGRSVELAHISALGDDAHPYALTTITGTGGLVRSSAAGYHVQVRCQSDLAGVPPTTANGAYADIIVESLPAPPPIWFPLTTNGQPAATIVVAESPTKVALYAARELQDHVRKITGATLPAVTDQMAAPGRRILVGDSAATRALGYALADFDPREYLVHFLADSNTVVCLGPDRDEFVSWTLIDGSLYLAQAAMPDEYDRRGSLNAVFDFLEKFCRVRWYYPTEAGTVYPQTPTLVVPGRGIRREPGMLCITGYRAAYNVPDRLNPLPTDETDAWRLRMRMGGERIWIDHSFYDYYDRFPTNHPDWFAQGYDHLPEPPQLCYRNPAVVTQAVQDARNYFDGQLTFSRFPLSTYLPPGSDFFPLVPMDDTRWCLCTQFQCPAHFEAEKTGIFSSGEISNYLWDFVNRVAAEVKLTHPDKYVASAAYHQHAYYPDQVALEDNVAVEFCLWNVRGWHIPRLREVDETAFDQWTLKERGRRPLVAWLYYLNPMATAFGHHFEVFPCFFAQAAIEQARLFHERGIISLFMMQAGEVGWSHLYDLPDHYLTLRLMENPDLDGEELFDEFFERYYGAAAQPMKALYLDLEATYTQPTNYPTAWLEDPNVRLTEEISWGSLGTPQRMTNFAARMDEARLAAQTDMEILRVDSFDQGVWQRMLKGAADHAWIAERRQHVFDIHVPQATESYAGDPEAVDWSQSVIAEEGLSTYLGLTNTVERDMEIRLVHDGEWLYIQHLEAVDASKLEGAAPFGSGAYTDPMFFDSIEFMAGTQAAVGAPYRFMAVIGVGAGTTYVDAVESGPIDWQDRWLGVCDKTLPEHWRAWMAIPLADLVPGGASPGTTFYGNFYRYMVYGQYASLVWRPHFEVSERRRPNHMGAITLENAQGPGPGVIMDANVNNGDFEDGYAAGAFWDTAGAPTGWAGSPANYFYNTAAGFVQGYNGGVATCNTGVLVDTNLRYRITADLGGFSNVRANVYVYATENADGSGDAIELAHISALGDDAHPYTLATVTGTGAAVDPGAAGYYVQVRFMSDLAGTPPTAANGSYGLIVVESIAPLVAHPFTNVALRDTFTMGFLSSSGLFYALEHTADLAQSNQWHSTGMQLIGTGSNMYFFDASESTGTSTARAYRVLAP